MLFLCNIMAISIHAAREGGDCFRSDLLKLGSISIHAAREGGDASCPIWLYGEKEFQSTPPVKAATAKLKNITNTDGNFNPRRP